jgi:hypothetical protein
MGTVSGDSDSEIPSKSVTTRGGDGKCTGKVLKDTFSERSKTTLVEEGEDQCRILTITRSAQMTEQKAMMRTNSHPRIAIRIR